MRRWQPLAARLWAILGGVSVRSKIMGMILGLTLLLGVGVTLQVRLSMTRALSQELQERGISIGRDLAARSADLILVHDTYALYQLLQDTVANNPDIRYAFIQDERGQVLVHSFAPTAARLTSSGFPRGLVEVNSVAPGQRYRWLVIATNEGPVHDFAVPIVHGHAGTARVGLSEARLQSTVDAVTGQLLLTTILVALVGLAAAAFLTWLLTRPILDLVAVTRAVARGDLGQKARRLADDEIGRLSDAFNRMVDDLAAARARSEAYNEALRRRYRELAVLNAVAAAVSAPSSLEEVLERALERVLQLMDLEAGWVMLTEQPSEPPRLACSRGMPPEMALAEVQTGVANCPCRQVLDTRRPLLMHPLPDGCPLKAMRLHDGQAVSCHAAIPLMVKSRPVGIFSVLADHPDRFGSDEMRLLSAIGAQLGVAIENAQLWQELRTKEALRGQLLDKVIHAQEEERKRIARGLHDETSQALTSFMVGLKLLEKSGDQEVRTRAAELRRTAADALEHVRRLALELRPSMLDDKGLVPALERYTYDIGRNTGLNVDFHTVGVDSMRLLPRAETALYRIVQEALANVVLHAGADNVSVILERAGDRLLVIVEDDGCGFDAERLLHSGSLEEKLGLFGMQERASLAGGELTIESRPGSGTTVFVTVPLDAATEGVP